MKNLICLFIIFSLFAFSSCEKEELTSEKFDPIYDNTEQCIGEQDVNTMCTQVYSPVCGCNNSTYSNECHARAAGVLSWTQGECQ